MADLLEDAVRKARTLPPEMREEIAHALMALMGADQAMIQLTPEEDADLAEAEAEVARGDVATDEEVARVLDKFSL